ncbi:Acetyl-CoA synthetase-like protein [Venustampulla echinocandica]|uniref:Acetyl-CoA synthetase-like protein n=1 Tax=Venustampulla echinocandica TaxID=2656787 RepID=A0A370TF39_9HELO|nr:Acetyl-CoA synthetase-like protein [Venustampulla echinocandica]RDL33291.1 Acetyl-CoA synthetase-like protein [Venustampulla echinocandica]
MDYTVHTSATPANRGPSLLQGPSSPPLKHITLGQLLDEQIHVQGPTECIVCPSLKTRWTYNTLQRESLEIAQGLLSIGVKPGDRIGILAGNCAEYIAVFFAVAYIGGVLVVLNNTYTASEALHALAHSGCRILFSQPNIGRVSMKDLLVHLGPQPKGNGKSEMLERIIMLRDSLEGFATYSNLKTEGRSIPSAVLDRAREKVYPDDVCNLQYTSGSTGHPKAAMLTHFNLVNNAQSIGDRLCFTPADILCCPPPLFHCFGLVLGVLAVISHGAKIILPSPTFSARAVLESLSAERCTALHGVPTMFEELLNLERPRGWKCDVLRTGIIAGAPVPRRLMKRLVGELGMAEFTSSYGLTEASPTCFNAFTHDSIHTRLTTVGKLLPHLRAKIVDRTGAIVPQGSRGELCIAGYSLSKGYFRNPEKTNEALRMDEEGTLWLYTGDEASFNEDGYCTITGRFRDIIIRGGENIYPVEIEDRLCAHASISRAAVVGIPNARYGEVVGAFLQHSTDSPSPPKKPTDEEIRTWTRQALGWHKAPVHIFWLGDEGAPRDIPQTGSGKIQKFELRALGESIVNARENRQKLRIEKGAKL